MSEQSDESANHKECFVISPIGVSGSETRKRADQIFNYIITPAIEPYGYSLSRGDKIDQPGVITQQVTERILNAGLVVADLTDQNPNVFYELAVRHAALKPFIHIIAEDQTLPFDVNTMRAIPVNYRDLDSVHEAKEQIGKSVEHIETGQSVETPITLTINWEQLRTSDNAEERGIADLRGDFHRFQRLVQRHLGATGQTPNSKAMKRFIETLSDTNRLTQEDKDLLVTEDSTVEHDQWVDRLIAKNVPSGMPLSPSMRSGAGFSDEPPF